MRNEHQEEFIDQRLYYMNDYKCKINLRIYKFFVRSVLSLKIEEEMILFLIRRQFLIYRKKMCRDF